MSLFYCQNVVMHFRVICFIDMGNNLIFKIQIETIIKIFDRQVMYYYRKDYELQKIRNISLDLRLVRQLSKPKLQQRMCQPKNLKQLGNMLKLRNNKYNYSGQEKDIGQQWIKKKGIDIKSLGRKMEIYTNEKQIQKIQKPIDQNSYFYYLERDIMDKNQYLNKQIQFNMLTATQKAMKNKNLQKYVKKKILSKLRRNANCPYTETSIYEPIPLARSSQKKRIYLHIIKDIVTADNLKQINPTNILDYVDLDQKNQQLKEKSLLFLTKFNHSFRNNFWSILLKQLEAYFNKKISPQKYKKQDFLVVMAIASITSLEEQFNKIMPSKTESIEQFLQVLYLNKIGPQQLKNEQKYWGIIYLLYRSGRKKEFYSFLKSKKHQQLVQQFQEYDKSVKMYDPISHENFWSNYHTDNIFYQQLVFILTGSSKYSSPILCQLNSLDISWMMLRTIGLYANTKEGYEKFISLRKQLIETYYNSELNEIKLMNICYLLSYADIVEMGPSKYIDTDDYLHLLLVLVTNPILIMGNQQKVKKKFCEKLNSYIHELILQQKQQYLLYMLLFPKQSLIYQVSGIIAASNILDDIDWNFFKQQLYCETNQQLFIQTMTKHINMHKNYILAAEKYYQYYHIFASDNSIQKRKQGIDRAVDTLLTMLIKSVLQIKFSKSQISNAEQLAIQWCHQNEITSKKYLLMLELIVELRKLSEMIFDRNINKCLDIIHLSKFIPGNDDQGSINTIEQEFNKRQALEVYVLYLQYVVRAIDMILFKKDRTKNKIDINYREIQREVNNIIKKYPKYSQKELIVNLKKSLESSRYQIK